MLAILDEGDTYGYAIIKRVTELSGGHLQWTDGMLYPVLHRLDARASRREVGPSENGRRRRYTASLVTGSGSSPPSGSGGRLLTRRYMRWIWMKTSPA